MSHASPPYGDAKRGACKPQPPAPSSYLSSQGRSSSSSIAATSLSVRPSRVVVPEMGRSCRTTRLPRLRNTLTIGIGGLLSLATGLAAMAWWRQIHGTWVATPLGRPAVDVPDGPAILAGPMSLEQLPAAPPSAAPPAEKPRRAPAGRRGRGDGRPLPVLRRELLGAVAVHSPGADREVVGRALDFAILAHEGQLRATGNVAEVPLAWV